MGPSFLLAYTEQPECPRASSRIVAESLSDAYTLSQKIDTSRCLHAISATDCPRAPARGPAPRPPALPAGGHYQREREILVLVNTTHPEKDREPVCYGFGSSEVRRARARRVTGNQLHEHSKRRAREHSLSEAPGAPRISHSCHSLPRAGHAGPALSPLDTLSPRCRERSHSSTRVRRTF